MRFYTLDKIHLNLAAVAAFRWNSGSIIIRLADGKELLVEDLGGHKYRQFCAELGVTALDLKSERVEEAWNRRADNG